QAAIAAEAVSHATHQVRRHLVVVCVGPKVRRPPCRPGAKAEGKRGYGRSHGMRRFGEPLQHSIIVDCCNKWGVEAQCSTAFDFPSHASRRFTSGDDGTIKTNGEAHG